jgi:site-specific recombinase XerD
MGKGRRARIVPFGHQTARALDRYERLRKSHKNAHLPAYWLAERGGAMTNFGVGQAIRRRGRQAGIHDLHAHMFRHTFAHYSKDVLLTLPALSEQDPASFMHLVSVTMVDQLVQ